MKCYLILALLLLSIYIKSDTPCEQITPTVDSSDCENGITEKKYCCHLRENQEPYKSECKAMTQEERDQINRALFTSNCFFSKSGSPTQNPQSNSSPTQTTQSTSSPRSSSSSFYLEVGILNLIFLLL